MGASKAGMTLYLGVGNCLKDFALTRLAIDADSWLGHWSCQLELPYGSPMCPLGFSQHIGLSIPSDRKRKLLVFLKQEKETASFLRDRKWAQHHFSNILWDKQSQCLHSRGKERKPNS